VKNAKQLDPGEEVRPMRTQAPFVLKGPIGPKDLFRAVGTQDFFLEFCVFSMN
jgi:hypothetical protein